MNEEHKALYDAISGIDPVYIEESVKPYRKQHFLLRFAAAAAMLVLVIGCLFFLPGGESEPLFFVEVRADDDLNVTITMTADVAEELPEDLEASWAQHEVFCVEIRMEGAMPEYLEASSATVEYEGRNVTESATWEQLSIRFPEDKSGGTLCRIYGWAKEMNECRLNFTVKVSNVMEGTETVLCAQPFEAFYKNYSGDRLIVNYDLTLAGEHSVTIEIMSTEELVDLIFEDENSPWGTFFSSTEHEEGYIKYYYEGVLAVLRTREDASAVMINRMRKYAQMTPEERREGPVYYPFSASALHIILRDPYYKDQLSEEDRQWFEEFEFWKTIAKPQDETPSP